MSFRSDFFDEVHSMSPALPMASKESVLLNTIDRGLTAQHRETALIRQQIEFSLSQAADRYREASDDASQAIVDEIAYQAEQSRQTALDISAEINWNIAQARIFLGAQITEVRWALERNTQVTQSVLDSLWKTHWIDSKQFYDEGVQCYESAERDFARERFQKAVEACRTNGFAYQFLGFLSVDDDDQEQALRYFELAAKFAPDNHHRAIARYHLARAWHAAGDEIASLDQIRAAVDLAPEDLAYRFELVHALMRAGLTQEAIHALRRLISSDLRYWAAAAADRTLDPMRAEITALLSKMLEEERVEANNLMREFLETIRIVESLPEPLPIVSRSTIEQKRSMESTLGRDTISAYRKVVESVPVSHLSFVETVIAGYRGRIYDSQRSIEGLEGGNLGRVNAIRAEIAMLVKHAAETANHFGSQEWQLNEKYKSKENGYGLALGCGGCLSFLGLIIFAGILFEFFGVKRSTGLPDTIGKLTIFAPLVLVLPAIFVIRWLWYSVSRSNLRVSARKADLEIRTRVGWLEERAHEASWRGAEELGPKRVETERLRAIYQNNITLLEKRMAVATRK